MSGNVIKYLIYCDASHMYRRGTYTSAITLPLRLASERVWKERCEVPSPTPDPAVVQSGHGR
jgi:hypothetical protein